jgi:GNAT superfamily N-acetyltransferase
MIRSAKVSDASSIAKVIVDTWQSAYSGIIDPAYPASLSKEKYSVIFQRLIREETEWIFVYETEKSILGFISGKEHKGNYDSEVKGLYVLPSYQGKGIGFSLLCYAKEYLKSSGCSNFILWTLYGAQNNGFYEANGGVGLERKKLKIGPKEYPAIGYCFDLEKREET